MESEKVSQVQVPGDKSKQEHNHAEGVCNGIREVNGVVNDYDDRISLDSSASDEQTLELPLDIPDGSEFLDLGAYINSVVNASIPPNDHSGNLNQAINLDHASNLTFNEQQNIDLVDCDGNGEKTSPQAVTPSLDQFDQSMFGVTDDSINGVDLNANFANFDSVPPSDTNTEFWAFGPTETNDPPVLNDQSLENSKLANNIDIDNDGGGGGDDDDDDFGDFECSAQPTTESPQTQTPAAAAAAPPPPPPPEVVRTNSCRTILECLLSRLGSSLDKAFEIDPDTNFDQLTTDCKCLEADSNPSSKDAVKTRLDTSNNQIWLKLCNPDRIPELRQHWWKSAIYASFLHSIDVNPGNAMPAFASQLRLLEPVRLDKPNAVINVAPIPTVNNVHSRNDDQASSNQQTQVTNLSPPPSIPERTNESSIAKASDSSTNPEINGIANLDLDFFENQLKTVPNGASQPKSAISMLNDLEAELLCQTIQPPPPTTISLLPNLTSNQPAKRTTLSETVLNTLSRLPKLAYMRSSRLMFPVQGQERSLTE